MEIFIVEKILEFNADGSGATRKKLISAVQTEFGVTLSKSIMTRAPFLPRL
jgi:hypothetical protein